MDFLLAYRAVCLYQFNRRLVIVNIIFFSTSVLISAALLILAYGGFHAIATPQYLSGCFSTVGTFASLALVPGT